MTEPLAALLAPASIRLDARVNDRDDAIRQAGAALADAGAVGEGYTEAMLIREHAVSTYIGEGVAVPHAAMRGSEVVTRDAIVVLRFAEAVDWNGDEVTVVVGIAARGNGHIALLSQLATVLLDGDRADSLRHATTPEQVIAALTPATP